MLKKRVDYICFLSNSSFSPFLGSFPLSTHMGFQRTFRPPKKLLTTLIGWGRGRNFPAQFPREKYRDLAHLHLQHFLLGQTRHRQKTKAISPRARASPNIRTDATHLFPFSLSTSFCSFEKRATPLLRKSGLGVRRVRVPRPTIKACALFAPGSIVN